MEIGNSANTFIKAKVCGENTNRSITIKVMAKLLSPTLSTEERIDMVKNITFSKSGTRVSIIQIILNSKKQIKRRIKYYG